MPILADLFVHKVTRDIPPVVYFHEQTPEKVAAEVAEYIVTGGWTSDHPNHKRVPQGIHEQYVKLLSGIVNELDRPGGPDLPNAWVSGFYGSGKSSFAKLLGLALDGLVLPDGHALADAWLARDNSPRAAELQAAWAALKKKVDPIAIVFDVGGMARSGEHVHTVAVRQLQVRLGYCSKDAHVAEAELALERSGEWPAFLAKAEAALGKPWNVAKDHAFAPDDFSVVMSALYPTRYADGMAWYASRAGTAVRADSPADAVKAIGDMLKFRRPGATLFIVADEISQFVHTHKDRIDRLRAFATELGAVLKGKTWLIALGQQKVDEQSGDSLLVWAKDRFPPQLRVHLATTNIRDVIHKRLLQKTPDGERTLREGFERHRQDLKLFAYGCDDVTPDEFVEVYPLLPKHIDLLLQITSALRTRSSRAQGDDQAIRGLLQLLGELFRTQRLAEAPLGTLVTFDQVYEVQHTALESDTQASMARVLAECSHDPTQLRVQVAKVVALLELIQETEATSAELVARCLFDRLDRGDRMDEVRQALESLRQKNLLGYSERTGYKLQSSSAEEWDRERKDIGVSAEAISESVQAILRHEVEQATKPKLKTRAFPWEATFSDGRRFDGVALVPSRAEASMPLDFRYLVQDDRKVADWVRNSGETAFANRLTWVVGETAEVDEAARELARSRAMVQKYKPRRESLSGAKRLLLQNEENRVEDGLGALALAVARAWLSGRMYFRGRDVNPSDHGQAFRVALTAAATRVLADIYPHFIETTVQPSELAQLLEKDLTGVSPLFLSDGLGILRLDAGRYVPSCDGLVPIRVHERIQGQNGISGQGLLQHFGGPPYGYTPDLVKAVVAGLLRGGKLKITPEVGEKITAVRDPGVKDIFEKDRSFKATTFHPADKPPDPKLRARICKLLEDELKLMVDREDGPIADAIASHFPNLAQRARAAVELRRSLPGTKGPFRVPSELEKLLMALDQCIGKARYTLDVVELTGEKLEVLRDGIRFLRLDESELTPETIASLRNATTLRDLHGQQLLELPGQDGPAVAFVKRLTESLSGDRPWRVLSTLTDDLTSLRSLYVEVRRGLLTDQGLRADAARARVKARDGFATLSADSQNRVLRPIRQAESDTTEEDTTPTLWALRDRFQLELAKAEERANDLFDDVMAEPEPQPADPRPGSTVSTDKPRKAEPKPAIQKVRLSLDNRVLKTPQDLEALLGEIRQRLTDAMQHGHHIRIIG